MNKLLKIRDVSSKYDISARALRYYEEMGLIESIRDIQRIFASPGSEAVLEVLGKR